MRSMTGFGEGTADDGELEVRVQIRSVNHRGLDVRWSSSAELTGFETAAVAGIKAANHRGRFEVRATLRVTRGSPGVGTTAQVEQAVAALREIREAHGIGGAMSVSDLLAVVDRIPAESYASERLTPLAESAFSDALAEATAFREREGRELQMWMDGRIDELDGLLGQITERVPAAMDDIRERLLSRVGAALESLGGDAGRIDEERLLGEIAVVADKSDIAEEIQRAGAHIEEVRRCIADDGAIGKRLDFLLQELIRETNTMASKSVDAEMKHRIVDAKTIVEQLREQAANVE